jgi:NADH-quinone oxidoreductase subunit C
MSEQSRELGDLIAGALPDAIVGVQFAYGELTIEIEIKSVRDVLRFLRDETLCRFIQLIDLTCVDHPERAKRFDVVYHLLSLHNNQRIRIKTQIADGEAAPSVIDVFPAAEWFEREAFDMYGVVFEGNPDMRRILTDYGFEGHPLRKDFPLTGHLEVRYDDQEKRVVYEPVALVQEYRNFDYLSPWEGAREILPGDEKAKD